MVARLWYQLHERTLRAKLLRYCLVKYGADGYDMVRSFVANIVLVESKAVNSFLDLAL